LRGAGAWERIGYGYRVDGPPAAEPRRKSTAIRFRDSLHPHEFACGTSRLDVELLAMVSGCLRRQGG
jgi:hypothetical protein